LFFARQTAQKFVKRRELFIRAYKQTQQSVGIFCWIKQRPDEPRAISKSINAVSALSRV